MDRNAPYLRYLVPAAVAALWYSLVSASVPGPYLVRWHVSRHFRSLTLAGRSVPRQASASVLLGRLSDLGSQDNNSSRIVRACLA